MAKIKVFFANSNSFLNDWQAFETFRDDLQPAKNVFRNNKKISICEQYLEQLNGGVWISDTRKYLILLMTEIALVLKINSLGSL